MSQKDKSNDDFIVMAEAGFIAINQADEDAAVKLFKAAQLIKPENSLPKIGMGYMHFLKLELKQASKVFQDVLDKEPENEMARAFLGLSIALTPNEANKGEKILEEAASKAKDSTVKNMAKTAIDFVEKFVKKAPSPATAPPKAKK